MVKRDFKDVVRETDSSVVSTGYSDVMQEIKKVVEEEKNVYSLNLIELGRVFLNIKDSLLVELDMKKHVQGMVSFVLDSSTTPVSVNERLHTVVNAEVWFLQQILGWCDRSEGKSESTKERINKAAALIEGTIKGLKDSDIRLNLP